MAANYLHGVETILIKRGPRPVTVVKAAVIGLIGLAPISPEDENQSVFDDTFDSTFTGAGPDNNKPHLVLNETDAAAFGAQIPGFTIPQALDAIFDQGAGTVVVVNVFDENRHLATVSDETVIITDFQAKTVHPPLRELVLTHSGGFTYLKNIHYTIDDFGNIRFIGAAISGADNVPVATGTCVASYKRLDRSLVTNADIIGAIDNNELRTGLKVFDLSRAMFGFKPRIMIAPEFSQIPAIATELDIAAVKYGGFALIDSVEGWTRAQALADRGPTGTLFNTSSYAAIGLFPRLKRYDVASDSDVVYPYSPYFAGVWAATINNLGYWYSPSNKQIRGITGLERQITADVSDAQTDANILNERGIVTFYNDLGVFTWGNRSLAYPLNTDPEQFLSIRMVASVIKDSIEFSSRQYIDQPINDALIDTIVESVNSFLRDLKGRGAIIDGEAFYDPARNSVTQLAAGNLTIGFRFMAPPPLERLTYEAYLDVNILSQLGGNQ